jgi:CheY-like chemotaxis protein
MRVLILDDQPQLAEMLATSVTRHGFSVLHFTSAREALEHIQETDVLISDYDMPEMTGLEVAQKAYAQGWRGPFLLMSSHLAALEEQVLPSFLNSILRKPFSPADLVREIEKLG